MGKCLLCNKKFVDRNIGTLVERKYCNARCGSIFRARRDYYNGVKKNFRKTSPILYKKLIKDNYTKNKKKWHSRVITLQFLKKIKLLHRLIPIKCKICNAKVNLEFHHETYPTTQAKIIDAVLDKKIYFLCKKCHSKLNRKIFK